MFHCYWLWNYWVIDCWLLVDLLIYLEQISVIIHWLLLVLWLQKVFKSHFSSTITRWSSLNRVILCAGSSCFNKKFLFRSYSWLILFWWWHVIILIFYFYVIYQYLSHTVNKFHRDFINFINFFLIIKTDIFSTGIKLCELTLHQVFQVINVGYVATRLFDIERGCLTMLTMFLFHCDRS